MLRAKFNKLYLVGVRNEASGEHRVAEREGKARPASIQFTISKTVGADNQPVGTLVIDEVFWKERFGGKKLLPGMGTAAEAAETLVGEANIFFGCPLCEFLTKDREEHTKHIAEHTSRLLEYLDIQLVEEPNDKT